MNSALPPLLALALCAPAAAATLDQLPGASPRIPEVPAPAAAGAEWLEGDGRYWVTVGADDRWDRTALLAAGLDIVETGEKSVSGLIAQDELAGLAAKGFFVKSRLAMRDYAAQHFRDFPQGDADYHNYAETEAALKALAAAHPAEASLFSIGRSIEGREIWCLRLNPSEKGEAPSSRPGAFFMGNHHGREHLTNEVALALAGYLLENKGQPEVRRYLDTLDIYIAPMTNPDGAEYDIASGKYRWHRKNTRVNPNKSLGVDLNRNYDARWCSAGASQSPSADTYCGPYAFSEPETRAIKAFLEPRRNITTLMSYHSYSSLLLYPWAGLDTPVEAERDRRVFETMGKAMGAATGYRPQQASDLYVAAGDTMDWAYQKLGVFAFTAELDGSTFYPGAAMIEKASAKNIRAALYQLSVTDDPYKVLR